MIRLALALACAVLALGCSETRRVPSIFPPSPALPLPPTPELDDEPQRSAGSLWRGTRSRRFLAFENRAKQVGDLLTVMIEEEATAKKEAKTELDRSSEFEATLNSDVALQTLVTRPILRILQFLGFTEQRTDSRPTGEVSIVDAKTEVVYDGEGKVSRKASFTTRLACLVTATTPSGLLQIEGERHLRINGETQIIRLVGYVRPEDVRLDNTVPSTLVAAADIQYNGVGVVTEEQRVPWLTRLFKIGLPF